MKDCLGLSLVLIDHTGYAKPRHTVEHLEGHDNAIEEEHCLGRCSRFSILIVPLSNVAVDEFRWHFIEKPPFLALMLSTVYDPS